MDVVVPGGEVPVPDRIRVHHLSVAGADLVVLDPYATPAMAHRLERSAELEEELAVLLHLGDERAVRGVYVLGEPIAGSDLSAQR